MIRPSARHRLSLAYAGLCAWIAGVSVHDAVLVVVYHNLISQTEQNPVGRWLIDVQGDIWLFVSLKLAGTALVCTVLVRLYRYRHDLAFVVALAVACFQLWLLIHLHFR